MTSAAVARAPRRTELTSFPTTGRRYLCLAIVVIATIVLYYQFYLAGAVAAGTNGKNGILIDYNMSFVYYVNIAVVGYILGAVASFVTGVADKVGRVNIITVGLVLVGVMCLLIPVWDTKIGFAVLFAAIGLVEGIILVATPALIRDFSPQLGRASAMGFWTLGPVLGSLVVSIQISSTGNSTPWHNHYVAAGIVGLVVAVLSGIFLRELAPELRDQLQVSEHDRALIEARAAGIDVEETLKHPFRQMLKADIVLSAFAISVFLIIYYIAVGFFPVYFQTIFGFSQSKANALGNWVWAFDAGALLLIGFLSDKLRVRKPFMVVGAIGAIVMTIIFLTRATHPETSYSYFVVILVLLAVFLGVAYAPWMASFTETVEKRNPALAATGLAIWGLVIRIVIAVSVFIAPHIVSTVSTLVEKGPVAQELAAKYAAPLAAAAKVDPVTMAALTANPKDASAGASAVSQISGVSVPEVQVLSALAVVDPATQAALMSGDAAAAPKAVAEISAGLGIPPQAAEQLLAGAQKIPPAQLQADGAKATDAKNQLAALGEIPASDMKVLKDAQKAKADSPKQWQKYFWIAVGGQVVFIPLIWLLTGFWSPRRAKKAEEEHEAMVQAELARLGR